MRFGIMGTGRITRRLVADLQSTDGVAVTAIASRSAERANWGASQYGIENAVEGYQALLDCDEVDAVYLALPPALHRQWAVAAAEAGKHVLCEKPLAVDAQQAIAIHAACQKAQVRWLDATAWLHHARSKQMLDFVHGGGIGKLGHVSAAVSFYRPFQSGEHRLRADLGGGALLDLGWYAVGIACRMAGVMPQRVFAACVMEQQVPLRANAMLWFDQDVTASLSVGYDTATRKWFEAAGSEASVICDDFTRPWADRTTRYWVHNSAGEVQAHECADRQEQRMIETLIGDQSLAEFNQFAIQTQAVLDALIQSARERQAIDVVVPSLTASP